MPQGKDTYGSKVGRPPKKKGSLLNDDRQQYAEGTKTKTIIDMGKEYIVDDSPSTLKSLLESYELSVLKEHPPKLIKAKERILYENYSREEVSQFKNDRDDIEALHAKGRTKKAEGGEMEDQMEGLAISVAPATIEEQTMLPDEEMEEDYVDFVVSSTLSEEDKNYLEGALAEDAKLSELFDQVVESASEFSGSGPINGPGSEVSDSIPARLSDGEFVFTAKATEEIGEDSLMSMMKDAEAVADERQGVAYGGVIDEEEQAVPIQTRGSRVAQGNIPNVAKQSRQVEEEMLKSSPRRYYVPVSG